MKLIYRLLTAGVTLLYLSSCTGNGAEHTHEHDHESDHHHDEHSLEEHASHDHDYLTEFTDSHDDEHDHDSDDIILKPETARRFGVTTDTVRISQVTDIIKVSGRLSASPSDMGIVSAPTSGIISVVGGIVDGAPVSRGQLVATISPKNIAGGDPNSAAKAALDGAKRELDRLTPLYNEGIVSGQDYNAALQNYETAKSLYSEAASTGRATSPISGSITAIYVQQGQFVNTGDPIASVSANTGMTLIADLPEKYYSKLSLIDDAVVKVAYDDKPFSMSELGGRRTTASSAASAAIPGYIPVVFTFNNNGRAMAGAMAEVYLKVRGEGSGISIPKSALSEQQGNFFVYVRLDEHAFRKTLVTTGGSDGVNILITSGLTPGEEIVVEGASIVHIAETSGTTPVGHSHNH